MTSREFIQRQFGNADGESKTLSSIFKDGKGNIYSYGSHYPLLFSVGGLNFRNNVGYSNTTGRHISWSRDVDAIDVWVTGCNVYTWRNPESKRKLPYLLYNYVNDYKITTSNNILRPVTEKDLMRAIMADLQAELADITKRIDSKTRTDTKIYAHLVYERNDCLNRISTVRGAL